MKYVSELKELSNKVFDTVEDLEKAEAEVNTAIAEKKAKVEARKADAAKVDSAIVSQKEIEKEVAKAKIEAYKEYLAKIDELNKKASEAKEATNKALEEFCKIHPEGYHSTVTFKDGSTGTYSYKTNSNDYSFATMFDKLFNYWF